MKIFGLLLLVGVQTVFASQEFSCVLHSGQTLHVAEQAVTVFSDTRISSHATLRGPNSFHAKAFSDFNADLKVQFSVPDFDVQLQTTCTGPIFGKVVIQNERGTLTVRCATPGSTTYSIPLNCH